MKVRTINLPSGQRIEWWYDPSAGVRSWVAVTTDAEGNQLGEATYSGTRGGIENDILERGAPRE